MERFEKRGRGVITKAHESEGSVKRTCGSDTRV